MVKENIEIGEDDIGVQSLYLLEVRSTVEDSGDFETSLIGKKPPQTFGEEPVVATYGEFYCRTPLLNTISLDTTFIPYLYHIKLRLLGLF